ncbi:hypothetical protein [Rhizobium leguminosarum]|uniref:hypothetical protein n=1 Tax=Rhizobium leguminosarum TaxID=384 RepID=UPI000486CE0E|nr:hypothetical protein [Rhizobium leguminosarum]WFT88012.1 hypothetical protein QA638_10650 [Rhizobium leguminosarum]
MPAFASPTVSFCSTGPSTAFRWPRAGRRKHHDFDFRQPAAHAKNSSTGPSLLEQIFADLLNRRTSNESKASGGADAWIVCGTERSGACNNLPV